MSRFFRTPRSPLFLAPLPSLLLRLLSEFPPRSSDFPSTPPTPPRAAAPSGVAAPSLSHPPVFLIPSAPANPPNPPYPSRLNALSLPLALSSRSSLVAKIPRAPLLWSPAPTPPPLVLSSRLSAAVLPSAVLAPSSVLFGLLDTRLGCSAGRNTRVSPCRTALLRAPVLAPPRAERTTSPSIVFLTINPF